MYYNNKIKHHIFFYKKAQTYLFHVIHVSNVLEQILNFKLYKPNH